MAVIKTSTKQLKQPIMPFNREDTEDEETDSEEKNTTQKVITNNTTPAHEKTKENITPEKINVTGLTQSVKTPTLGIASPKVIEEAQLHIPPETIQTPAKSADIPAKLEQQETPHSIN